jgi:mannose-6-phosphate isomerase-like protein (cupin superfamily)
MTEPIKDILEISAEDVSAFSAELASGQIVRSEDFANDTYLDAVIDKPWGHEYRVYADMLIDVWKLTLSAGQSTSMHCHPRKETVLICLDGILRVNFLNGHRMVNAGEMARISKGVFHSTDNVGRTDAHLLEVETPRNKFDLVRKKDRYGRQGQQYETTPAERPVPPLMADPHIPFAKLRGHDIDHLYAFEVSKGIDILKAAQPPFLSVSLSIEAAINQRIDVCQLGQTTLVGIKPEVRYLTVTRP